MIRAAEVGADSSVCGVVVHTASLPVSGSRRIKSVSGIDAQIFSWVLGVLVGRTPVKLLEVAEFLRSVLRRVAGRRRLRCILCREVFAGRIGIDALNLQPARYPAAMDRKKRGYWVVI